MSNNEEILNSNEGLVKFTSDYSYVLGATMGRSLEFAGLFHSSDFLVDQIEQIRADLEDTAKYYAEQQGLAPGAIGWGYYGKNLDGTAIRRENTGRLYNGIKAIRTGRTVHLRSEARDDYGHYYGGHVEFGHQNVPARPHLRPALYTTSEASRGKLRSALHNLLIGAFSGDMNMYFGTGGGLSASYYKKGQGNIVKHLSTGERKQQAKYHFGSIRRDGGRHISRKGQTFRKSFSSTAKKSMKWGKQKSLNQAQRNLYRKSHTNSGRTQKRQQKILGQKLRSSGVKGKAYSRTFNKYYKTRGKSPDKFKTIRRERGNQVRSRIRSEKRQQKLLRHQLNNYYGHNNQYTKTTGIHSQRYLQKQNAKTPGPTKVQKAQEKSVKSTLQRRFDNSNKQTNSFSKTINGVEYKNFGDYVKAHGGSSWEAKREWDKH